MLSHRGISVPSFNRLQPQGRNGKTHYEPSRKAIWLEEFGACSAEMPEADVPRWMELAITGGIAQGISWFTWWASHDVNKQFEFHPFEYSLGLMTVDNKIKEQGRVFKRLAEEHRGKPVVIPDQPLLPPPAERNNEATWQWLLAWMNQSIRSSSG